MSVSAQYLEAWDAEPEDKKVGFVLPDKSNPWLDETAPPADLPNADKVVDEEEAERIKREESVWQKLQACKFDPDEEPERLPPVLLLKGVPVIWKRNVHAIIAHSKVGKTAVNAAMAHTLMHGVGKLGFTSGSGTPLRVGYIDLEQDTEDFWDAMQYRAKMQKGKSDAYRPMGFSIPDICLSVELVLRKDKSEVLFLDGLADLVTSVLDEAESIDLFNKLMALADKYDAAIIGVIHLNPGSDEKSRGHLGSHAERKCKTVIQIDKDKSGIREIYTRFARKKDLPKGHGQQFQWSDEDGEFVAIDGTADDRKMAAKYDERHRLLQDVEAATEMKAWRNKNLIKAVEMCDDVRIATAKTRIREMVDFNLLRKNTKGEYISTIGEGQNDGQRYE